MLRPAVSGRKRAPNCYRATIESFAYPAVPNAFAQAPALLRLTITTEPKTTPNSSSVISPSCPNAMLVIASGV